MSRCGVCAQSYRGKATAVYARGEGKLLVRRMACAACVKSAVLLATVAATAGCSGCGRVSSVCGECAARGDDIARTRAVEGAIMRDPESLQRGGGGGRLRSGGARTSWGARTACAKALSILETGKF